MAFGQDLEILQKIGTDICAEDIETRPQHFAR
jgi:hypothetical protein